MINRFISNVSNINAQRSSTKAPPSAPSSLLPPLPTHVEQIAPFKQSHPLHTTNRYLHALLKPTLNAHLLSLAQSNSEEKQSTPSSHPQESNTSLNNLPINSASDNTATPGAHPSATPPSPPSDPEPSEAQFTLLNGINFIYDDVVQTIEDRWGLLTISPNKHRCWLRASWLNILLQTPPNMLFNKITALMPEAQEIAFDISQMAILAQENIMNIIVSDKTGMRLALDARKEVDTSKAAENSLELISRTLLLSKGFTEQEMTSLFDNQGFGEDRFIEALNGYFNCYTILVSDVSKELSIHVPASFADDRDNAILFNAAIQHEQLHTCNQACLILLDSRLSSIPILFHTGPTDMGVSLTHSLAQGSHFDLLIPRSSTQSHTEHHHESLIGDEQRYYYDDHSADYESDSSFESLDISSMYL